VVIARRRWLAAALCVTIAGAIAAVAAVREWESPSPAASGTARIGGSDYSTITGQMVAVDQAAAQIAPGIRSCGARMALGSYDSPPTCFRAASDGFVRTALGLWTTLGGLEAHVARPCQTRLRNLRLQLDLTATLVKQTDMAVENLDFDHFHALAGAIPQLAPMYAAARRQFAAACSPV
jgi:hypothetical protein